MNVALRPDSLNLISLCTGGGGLDLGVELAMPGARSVVLVEREAFAVSQLVSAIQQGLMAPAAIWSDVTTFNGRPWRGLVDGLIGGIPCQPHSLAGKRLGEDDERDLWSDARRIIVQSGAWFVLIENVRGMLSSGGAERVWRDLHRLGFAVEGGLFTAAEVGASHERERIFILGVANSRSGGALGEPGDICAAPHDYRTLAAYGTERNAGNGGAGLADADSKRLERIGPDARAQGRPDARRPAGLRDGTALEHATGERWREGRPEPIIRGGRDSATSPDDAMGHAISGGHHGRANVALRRSVGRAFVEGPGKHLGLFPPGPSDLSRWRHTLERAPELEPAFRRVAYGLASRLDTARVDRLRMLGNGVVCLEAAYAVRTLATRLAASGSSGAARLVRMMEISATETLEAAE